MADRNEVFRIILEGRDKLSDQLKGVRQEVTKLDDALTKLKRNKTDDFPLFGGGKATRGPGGQFIKKEEISLLDQARRKVDDLGKSVQNLRKGRLKEGEFALFGGGKAIKNELGQFVKVEDISRIDRARASIDKLGNSLVRLKTRVIRGPLVQGEIPGAGGTRLARDVGGRFVKAEDITLTQRLKRELSALRSVVRNINDDTKGGIAQGVRSSIDDVRRLDNAVSDLGERIKTKLLGSGKTRTGVDPITNRFISVRDITTLGKAVDGYSKIIERIKSKNKEVADAQKEMFGEFKSSFRDGVNNARAIERIINENIVRTKEEFKEQKEAIAQREQFLKVALTAQQQAERISLRRKLNVQSEADDEEIENLREHLRRMEKTEDNFEERKAIKRKVRSIQTARREREVIAQQELTADFQARRASVRVSANEARRQLERPDVAAIQAEAKRIREEFLSSGTAIERLGKRAGVAFGDIVRGAKAARSGLRDINQDSNLLRNTFTRLGFAFGSIFKNFDQLVNLRWLFITGILTTFFTIIVQVGTALVALAASAIQAGAALGGAFVAGVAQALPAIGLLAAAVHEFSKVLDLVKQTEKTEEKSIDPDKIKTAAQRYADAQYAVKQAIQGVADAQYQLKQSNLDLLDSYKKVHDATKDLAKARIQAARDIVDANLEEKDAALSLQEAELGVLDAKKKLREEENKKAASKTDIDEARAALKEAQERLKIAKAQGDESEISSAQQQATIAEQNLNSILDKAQKASTAIKDAQLGVKRSELTLEQARVRDKRAREDAAKARKEGVAGSDIVKNAQDSLKDAIKGVADAQRQVALANRGVQQSLHQVAVAQRDAADARKEHTDAIKGDSQAQRDAAKAFADLSPSEKKLFASLKRIRKAFNDLFAGTSKKDGLLGPIIDAFAGVIDQIYKLLTDPQIKKAIGALSTALGSGIKNLAKILSGSDFKDDLIFFISESIKNIPKIVSGLTNLFQIFINIAKAATPIFNDILDRIVGVTDKVKNLTSLKGESRRPEEGAGGRQGQVAKINESGISKFLDSASKNLDSWLKLSGAILRLIFAITNSGAADSGKNLVDNITDALNGWSDWIDSHGKEVSDFFSRNVESVKNLAEILGRLGKALVIAFSSEEFEAFVQVMAEVIIPGLLTLIAVLGQLSKVLLALFKIPVLGPVLKWAIAFLVFEKGLNKIFPVTQKITEGIKTLGGALIRSLRAEGIKGSIETIRLKFMYLKDAIAKAGKAISDFAVNTGKIAAKGVQKGVDAITSIGKAALTAAKRVGVALYASLVSLARIIGTAVVNAIRILTLNIRLLVSATVIGALITAAILIVQHWDKIKAAAKKLGDFLLKTFGRVVDWVKENWKKVLVAALLAPFLPAAGILFAIYKFRNKILDAFKTLGGAIKSAFSGAFEFVKEKFKEIVGWIQKQYDKLPGPVKVIIRGYGKVLGAAGKVAGGVAGKVGDIKGAIGFAGGGSVPGKTDTVPAMLTPGEWVFNREQQLKLAKALGMTVAQVKAYVFGTNTVTPPKWAIAGAKGKSSGSPSSRTLTAPQGGLFRKYQFRDYNLVSKEDDDGNTVWFIELDNGSFGQVTSRDADKIQKTKGTWIPNYVKRSVGGFSGKLKDYMISRDRRSGFSLGGVVPSPAIQRFAEGGIVQAPGHGGVNKSGESKTINQNFNVRTEGETDWGYVMRLSAIHAQESF